MISTWTILRRSCGVALVVATAATVGPFLGASALAQQNPPKTTVTESSAVHEYRQSVERDIIRYRLSYLLGGQVFHTLSKDGNVIGPTFLTILPEAALDGSEEGLKHLRRARRFHWANLGVGAIALGLLSGAAIVRFNEKHWSSSAEYLAGGGAAALFIGVLLGYNRQEELMAAIDAHNHDVLTRR